MDYKEYALENDVLRVTITSWGAQVKSVVRKSDGVEHMWDADASVWGFHAPILFPHTGKLVDGILTAKGKDYPSGQHGFAMHMTHRFVSQSDEELTLVLESCEESRIRFPYEFRLYSIFRLEGDSLLHTLTVENRDEAQMPFGIGYHPAFRIPFDNLHTYQDYELRFDQVESPLCLSNRPNGLMNGKWYYLGKNIDRIPIDDQLFSIACHNFTNLRSSTLGIYERNSNRAVVCNIAAFPHTLIWSKPGTPRFVCIEPWHSLPSKEGSSTRWDEKPAAAILSPGESWSTTLKTSFIRT